MPRHPLVGVWKLLSCELHGADGDATHPFGKNPGGYVIYTPVGVMSVTIAHADRPSFSTPDIFGADAAEKAAAFETYVTYCGHYEIRGEAVIHHVETALFPGWTGASLARRFRIDGDRLTLTSTPFIGNGVEQTSVVVWERCQRVETRLHAESPMTY